MGLPVGRENRVAEPRGAIGGVPGLADAAGRFVARHDVDFYLRAFRSASAFRNHGNCSCCTRPFFNGDLALQRRGRQTEDDPALHLWAAIVSGFT